MARPCEQGGPTSDCRSRVGSRRSACSPCRPLASLAHLLDQGTPGHGARQLLLLLLAERAFSQDSVSGPRLRQLAWQAARTRTVSVNLELPTGIGTLHSRLVGDVSFRPAATATPALCA